MPRAKKEPTLTSQITELSGRKLSIIKNQSRATQMTKDYQAKLDKAEELVVEAVTNCMANDTPANQETASEARISRNLIMQGYEQAKNDIAMIPGALKKLDTQINALTAQKKILEQEVIAEKLVDTADLEEKASKALSELAAVRCMQTTRNVNYTDITKVVAQLNNDKSVSRQFIHRFNELNDQMGFEQL